MLVAVVASRNLVLVSAGLVLEGCGPPPFPDLAAPAGDSEYAVVYLRSLYRCNRILQEPEVDASLVLDGAPLSHPRVVALVLPARRLPKMHTQGQQVVFLSSSMVTTLVHPRLQRLGSRVRDTP